MSNTSFVSQLLNIFVFWISFEVCFKVVAVLLLLLCHVAEEESIVVDGSLSDTLLHSALTTLMSFRIAAEFSCVEFLNAIEKAVKLRDALLDVIPSLIKIATVWNWKENTLARHLAVNFFVSLMHSIKFLMSLLQALQFVCRVNQNAVSLVRVNMNVYVCGWNGLHVNLRAITEQIGEVDSSVFLTDIEM